jgi:hypothetical protein
MPLTNAEVDSAVPAAGEPNRALTNAALKELIADIPAAISAHEAAGDPHPGYLTAAEGNAAYQPLSANLTEYAAVNPTAQGLALLDDADAAAQRTTLGLVIGTDVDAFAATVSQAEAEAGTATTVRNWTAQRVAQAIAALAPGGSPAWGSITGTLSDQTDLQAALDDKVTALAPVTINASTNLTRASHGNRLLICNSGSAINLTIEDDTTGAWEDGDFFAVMNIGAGTVTIQGDGTSTVTAVPGYALTIPQNGIGAAQRSGANAWSAYGQLAVQAQATWEAGASTTPSIVSPAHIAAAIAALAPAGGSSYGFQHEYKFWAEQSSTSTTAGQLPASHLASVVGTIASSGASYSTSYGAPRGVCTGSDAVVDSGVFVFRGKTTSAFFVPGATDSQQIIFEAVFACVDANAGRRWAEGLYINGGVAPAVNANPNSWVNVAIFGKDSGDSNIQVMTNDATSTAAKVDLGANFPATAGLYYARLVFTGGATRTLDYYIKRLDTGNVASGQITADLPVANTAGLTYITWGSNGPTTASAITFEHSYMRLAGRYTVG